MRPYDKVIVRSVGSGPIEGTQTQADLNFNNLTAEVLRDIARNESNSREWRKAAVKFLRDKNHKYAGSEYFRELVFEIDAEVTAEHEVLDIVETATEEVLKSEKDLKIEELEAEITRLKNQVPKFTSSFKSIEPEDVSKLLEE